MAQRGSYSQSMVEGSPYSRNLYWQSLQADRLEYTQTYLEAPSAKEIPIDKYVHFEWVIWNVKRKFRDVLVSSKSIYSQFRVKIRWNEDRDPEVHVIIADKSNCPRARHTSVRPSGRCDLRIGWCPSGNNWSVIHDEISFRAIIASSFG